MQKMPRIWMMYTDFLIRQELISKTRQTFNRALESLPVSQHDFIWEKYLNWVHTLNGCPETQNSII